MSIFKRSAGSGLTLVRAIAALAIAVVIGACSSAATVAPAATGAPAATAAAAATASPSVIATASPEATATLAPTVAPTSSPAPTGPTTTPMLVDPFTSAGITEVINTVAHAVDESKYVTTVAGSSHRAIYVVFALKPETVGKVTMVMTMGGVNVADPLTIDYQTKNSWGDFKINFPSSGMPVGDYQATMTYEPSGAAVTVFFTVT
jgi:hypothetical protein